MSETKLECEVIQGLSSHDCQNLLTTELTKPNPSQANVSNIISRCYEPLLNVHDCFYHTGTLWHPERRHSAIKMIAKGLEGNTIIKHLVAHSINLNDDDAVVIANLLKYTGPRASHITFLNLQSNNIGDKGATALAEMLGTNTSLHTLMLDRNSAITDVGWKSFEKILVNLENITLLKGNFVSNIATQDSDCNQNIQRHFRYLVKEKYEQAAKKAKIVEKSLEATGLPKVLLDLTFAYTDLGHFKKFEKKKESVAQAADENLSQHRAQDRKNLYLCHAVLIIVILLIPLIAFGWIDEYMSDKLAAHLTAGTGGSIIPNYVTWTVCLVTPLVFILLRSYLKYQSSLELSDTEFYEMPLIIGEKNKSEVLSGETNAVI